MVTCRRLRLSFSTLPGRKPFNAYLTTQSRSCPESTFAAGAHLPHAAHMAPFTPPVLVSSTLRPSLFPPRSFALGFSSVWAGICKAPPHSFPRLLHPLTPGAPPPASPPCRPAGMCGATWWRGPPQSAAPGSPAAAPPPSARQTGWARYATGVKYEAVPRVKRVRVASGTGCPGLPRLHLCLPAATAPAPSRLSRCTDTTVPSPPHPACPTLPYLGPDPHISPSFPRRVPLRCQSVGHALLLALSIGFGLVWAGIYQPHPWLRLHISNNHECSPRPHLDHVQRVALGRAQRRPHLRRRA